MNKKYFIPPFLVLVAMMMAGCSGRKEQKNDAADTVSRIATTGGSASATDTLAVKSIAFEKEETGGFSHLTADFPIGPDCPARRAVIDYILGCLTANWLPEGLKLPPNTCDEAAFATFLEALTQANCHAAAEAQQDYYAEEYSADLEDEYKVQWFTNMSVSKIAESDRYVSYVVYTGEFVGGAHDQRGSMAATIRKADGARIDIFNEDLDDSIQPVLWKYLIGEMEPEDRESYRSEIKQFLKANYGQDTDLHIPGAVCLQPDGVHLLYDPLEISFWPEEPDFVIPYDEAKPFLTEEARELIP